MKGAGTDLVSIPRMGQSLARGEDFADEVFTDGERRYCQAQRHPTQHFAARFAAKEAFLKALGLGIFSGFSLKEIEVRRDQDGPPRLELGPSAAAALERAGATRMLVSLAHERDYALAVVILL
jgi:holo-[acyl-carrier protein] synthase